MCLGVPGRVIGTYREHDLLMAQVDFGGVTKQVCLAHTPEAQPGDYVIVHVGFALSLVDEDEAQKVFQFLERLEEPGDLEECQP